jgi:hypothetical protein
MKPENPKKVEKNIQSGGTNILQGSRNVTDFLPTVFKTPTNKKFLSSTLENLFSSGTTENVDAYWGKITPSIFDYNSDNYNKETTTLRENYQFSPGLKSQGDNFDLNASYINTIKSLESLGYRVDDMDKLLAERDYILDLPINHDMFVNYLNYHWIVGEIPLCVIEPTSSNPIDIDNIVYLNSYTTPILENGKTLTFVNGMRIKFIGSNVSSSSGNYNADSVYIVEGVGTGAIKLIEQFDQNGKNVFPRSVPYTPNVYTDGWDIEDFDTIEYDDSNFVNILKEYVVIDRTSIDKNPWARINKWSSIYAIRETADYNGVAIGSIINEKTSARRPIIQFNPNIELFNNGTLLKVIIDHHIDGIGTDQIIGEEIYFNNGYYLEDGDYLLITDFETDNTINIYEVSGVGTSISLTLKTNTFLFEDGDKFFISHSNIQKYVANEFYFNNGNFIQATQKQFRSDSPLFVLYDITNTRLDNFDESNFKGNSIFSYKTSDTTIVDDESGLRLVSDSNSPEYYLFEMSIEKDKYHYNSINNITVSIEGDYFYKTIGKPYLDFRSIWSPSKNIQRSQVSEIVVVESDNQVISNNIKPLSDITEYIVTISNSGIIWFSKRNDHIYSDGEKNPNIVLHTNTDYNINYIIGNETNIFQITDPFGNIPTGVSMSNDNTNKITINISDSYEYDTLLYNDIENNFIGYIFVESAQDFYTITKNGEKLQKSVDFVDTDGFIKISTDLKIGDIIEFKYYTEDASKPREVSPSFKYNPLNEKIVELSLTEITDHIVKQNIANPYLSTNVFVGDNDYHKTVKITTADGNIRQQIYSPASLSILNSIETFDLLESIDIIKVDYESFKNVFKNKVRQLWNNTSYTTVRDLVDDALSQINIGKDDTFKYANSNMAYYSEFTTYTYSITDSNMNITVPFSKNKYGDIFTIYQLWINYDGNWVPLKEGVDYNFTFNNIEILDIGAATQATVEIRLYNNKAKSFIPYSPSKIGFTKKYKVSVDNEKIVCHDGSIHTLSSSEIFDMNSSSFDVVSSAVYDLETRIYNNLQQNEKNIFELLPTFNNYEYMNYSVFNELMKEECYDWASIFSNGYSEELIDDFDPVDKFTFNYSSYSTDYQSYKSLYKYLFNTDRPHTHPWEMFGYVEEPSWWATTYSWAAGPLRDSLIESLKNGKIGLTETVDPKYAYYHYDWDNKVLVTTSAELNDPITAEIISESNVPIGTRFKQFSFGNKMFKIEEDWQKTSSYTYSVVKTLFKLKPYKLWNLFWIANDIKNVENTNKYYEYYDSSKTRTTRRSDNLHLSQDQFKHVYDVIIPTTQSNNEQILNVFAPVNELYGQAKFEYETDITNTKITNIVITDSGFGYKNDFKLIIQTATGFYTTELTAKVENIPSNIVFGINSLLIEQHKKTYEIPDILNQTISLPIVHIGGFTKSELTKVELDGSFNKGKVRIPPDDYSISLIQSPPTRRIRYSGLILRKTIDGLYEVEGYNKTNRYFNYIPVNTNGTSVVVDINQSNSIVQYQKFHNRIEKLPYGTKFKKRQDLYNFIIGLEAYYNFIGFNNLSWKSDAITLIEWTFIVENDNFTYVNGIKDNMLIYNNLTEGFVKEFTNYSNFSNPIINNRKQIINPSDLLIIRNGITTGIKPKNQSNAMFGITIDIVEYEHILNINPVTKFGDIVQKTSTGILNSRIKIKTERTKNWNGRLETSGFLVTDNAIINNFDSQVREVETDLLNTNNKSLNVLTRKTDKFTVGYQEKSYFANILNNEFSSYDFYRGVRKYKGTQTSIDALVRNKNIFSKNPNSISEEWMIYSKDYGDKSISDNIQIELPLSLVKTEPQIIRFNPESVKDNIYDTVIDISKGSSNYISGNFENPIPLLPAKPFTMQNIEDIQNFENFSKTAGIPFESEVEYVVNSVRDMLEVYDYSASYANILPWSSKVSYQKGDIVRRGPSVYQYLLDSTGFAQTAGQIFIRGTVTFPKVPSLTNFIIGIKQRGEDELTYNEINFAKTAEIAQYNPLEYIGSVANPTTDVGNTISINGTTITFSASTSTPVTPSNQTITATGTTNNFTVEGKFLDQIIIDDYRIRLSNLSTTLNPAISLLTTFNLTAIDLQSFGIPESVSTEMSNIPQKLKQFRDAFISANSLQEWYQFISGYYSGIYENYGFNINYLTQYYSTLSIFSPFFSEFEEFYQNEIDIYEKIFQISITKGVTQVSTANLNTMNQYLRNATYPTTIARYIKSGGPINGSDFVAVTGTFGQGSLNSSQIVSKINEFFTENNLSDTYTASIFENKLRIVKKYPLDATSGVMNIITDTGNFSLGFPNSINVYNTLDELIFSEFFVSLQNMVTTINSVGLNGVTAAIHTVGGSSYLKIINNNPQLVIAEGTANTDIGFEVGVYNSTFIDGTEFLDLDINDVIEQINAANIPNFVASNVNNSVVLSAVVSEIDIGNGTANPFLGFSDTDTIFVPDNIENDDIINNVFDSTEWQIIDDPIDFSVWVNDNLDPLIDNTNRQSGYNVYTAFDFELEIFEICPGILSNDDAMVKFLVPHNLQVNDYVILTATNSTPILDGIHRVTAIYSDTIIFVESYIRRNGSYGKCIPLRPVRFSTTQQLINSGTNPRYQLGVYGWKPGMYAYVDSYEGTNIPAVYRCIEVDVNNGAYFELVRKLEPVADNSKLVSAYVYNYKTKEINAELEVYDPVKGIIPGIADIELTIKSIYDNARYTDSTDQNEEIDPNNFWSDDHIGETWWDMSTAVYLEYEQGLLENRQQNWGKLYPTSSIDVYEWTKSPVPPDEYQQATRSNTIIDGIELTGTPYFTIGQFGDREYYWSEKTFFNRSRGISETYYYFWVKDKTTVPNNSRRYTTIDLENIIENPSSYGISWIAGISSNAVLASNLSNCLSCENAVLNILFKNSDDNYHREYMLLSEDNLESKIPIELHDTLRDSLAGYTGFSIKLDYSPWLSFKDYKKDDVVKYENRYYIAMQNNKNVVPVPQNTTVPVTYNTTWYELKFIDSVQNEDFWNIKKYGYVWDEDEWDTQDWSKPFPENNLDDVDGEIYIKPLYSIPDYDKHILRRLGINEPKQTWFNNITNARREFIVKLNSILKEINMLDIRYLWYDDFNSIFHPSNVEYDSYYTDYKLSDVYSFVDWKSSSFNVIVRPQYKINSIDDLAGLQANVGEYAIFIDTQTFDNISRQKIYKYDGESWNLVYHEKATIQFSEDLWNPALSDRNWSEDLWDIGSWDRDTGPYFYRLTDLLYNKVFDTQFKSLYNEIWFTMLKYVHSEQDFVKWAIKSSYFKFVLENDFSKNKLYKKDLIQDVLDYINDVKPFTSKLRDFVNKFESNDSMNIALSEQDERKIITLNYSDTSSDTDFNGDVVITNTFNTDQNIDIITSDMTTTTYDYIYDGNGMDYSNEQFSDELVPARIVDSAGIFITRNVTGNTETIDTKRYVIYSDYRNKLKYSISTNDDISTLTANVLPTDTEIQVADGSIFEFNSETSISQDKGVIWINGERIEYANVLGNTLLNCVRGISPRSHSIGDTVLYTNGENTDYPPIELSTIQYNAINYNL